MKKNLGAAPMMFPQPVLIIATYDENGYYTLGERVGNAFKDGKKLDI